MNGSRPPNAAKHRSGNLKFKTLQQIELDEKAKNKNKCSFSKMCNLHAASAGDPRITLEPLCLDSSQDRKQQKAMCSYPLFKPKNEIFSVLCKSFEACLFKFQLYFRRFNFYFLVHYPDASNQNYVQFSNQCLEIILFFFKAAIYPHSLCHKWNIILIVEESALFQAIIHLFCHFCCRKMQWGGMLKKTVLISWHGPMHPLYPDPIYWSYILASHWAWSLISEPDAWDENGQNTELVTPA